MITLHRLGHTDEPFQLNPDLIVTVESTPDTVVTLATTAKVVVAESPDEVADLVRAWRVDVLSEAMRNRRGGREQEDEATGIGRTGSVQSLPRRPGRVEVLRPPADERGR
jgi:flagellar protein FlbD